MFLVSKYSMHFRGQGIKWNDLECCKIYKRHTESEKTLLSNEKFYHNTEISLLHDDSYPKNNYDHDFLLYINCQNIPDVKNLECT